MTIPEPVLSALDRLNGHARAYGCGKAAIYTYKTLAAIVLAEAGELTARPVQVEARCSACGGSGYWRDWDHGFNGERICNHTPCRRCARRGYVTLRFVETRHGERVWHHPAADSGHEILRAAWRITEFRWPKNGPDIAVCADGAERPYIYVSVTDWQPNRPGERLEGEDAAALLNAVEDWLVIAGPTSTASQWPRERALREMRSYTLRLSHEPRPDICCKCDGPVGEGGTNLGALRYRLDWSEPCCRACYSTKPFDWPQTSPPERLLTPEVRRWLDRRGIDLRQSWKPAEHLIEDCDR